MKKLADNVATGAELSQLEWEDFENLTAAGFAANGFQVQRTAAGADGGIDLLMAREGHRFAVQCKHYRSGSIGVEKVRAFYGAMIHAEAEAGYFVTSGDFTSEARAFVEGKSLFLYNGGALLELLARGRDAASPGGRLILDRAERSSSRTPACPLCRRTMQLKVAKQGTRTGKRFFGCSAFPDCRGTINVD
jgi:restriction system protein